MFLKRYFLGAMLVLLVSSVGRGATFSGVSANSTSVGQYDRYELTFNLNDVSPPNLNPFRPETSGDDLSPAGVDVWAEITTPSEEKLKIWGYWDVDMEYLGQIGDHSQGWAKYDKWVPNSDPHWKVRYSPTDVGVYRIRLFATDQSGTTSGDERTFNCVAGQSKGFIKLSPDGKRLVHSNGQPYIAMGASIKDDTGVQETYLPKMAENGLNFGRTWIVNGNMGDVHRELFPQTWKVTSGEYDNGVFHSGHRSVRLNAPKGDVWETFVAVRGDADYRAAAWIKTSPDFNGTAAVEATVRYTDDSRKVYAGNLVPGGQDWTHSIVSFESGANGKTADFVDFRIKVHSGTSGSLWVDDAELYEVNRDGSVKVNYNYLWAPSFEQWNPSQLRIQPLWRLDHLLTAAENNGISILACIFDYRLWNASNPTGFYSRYFGDFWTDPASTRQQDRTLRYLIARFSAFRSLFGWELTNEMDPHYSDDRVNWISARASFLKKNDPEKHIVTNSYWTTPNDPRFLEIPAIDVVEVHNYINTEERKKGQGVPGWWDQPAGIVIDRDRSDAHSGESSLKFTANGKTLDEHQDAYLKPNRSYTMSCWIRTQGVMGTAKMNARFYNLEGNEELKSISLTSSGTTDYSQKQATFTTPADCSHMEINPQLTGSSGNAWFDDIQVIDNTTGRNVFYNGGFESPNFGDDEYEWAVYNNFLAHNIEECGPNPVYKPIISGEFGLMGLNSNLSEWANPKSTYPRHDTEGLHIHNGLWADFMASSASRTPTYWWINEYLLSYNLLGDWKGITSFSSGLPFYDRGETITTEPYLGDVSAKSSNREIRVLGQKQQNQAYCWIQNSGHIWSKVIREGVSPTPASAEISIPGFANGIYNIDWYNTATGKNWRSERKTVTSGTLTFSVDALTTDTAMVVRPEK